VIRWASDFDLEKLLELQGRADPPGDARLSRALMAAYIANHCVAIATAGEDGRGPAIGFGVAREQGGAWVLSAVTVHPEHRGMGLGKRIVESLLRQAPPGSSYAAAYAVNEAGAKLLSSAGFTGHGRAFSLTLQKAA
jgi:GNAT superfamily N-acetyltransferase